MTEAIAVQELGRTITFSFDDMLKYHGPGSPGGVAVAFKALQRAFEVLSPGEPPARRSIVVRTPFRGPGARDGFEAMPKQQSHRQEGIHRAGNFDQAVERRNQNDTSHRAL